MTWSAKQATPLSVTSSQGYCFAAWHKQETCTENVDGRREFEGFNADWVLMLRKKKKRAMGFFDFMMGQQGICLWLALPHSQNQPPQIELKSIWLWPENSIEFTLTDCNFGKYQIIYTDLYDQIEDFNPAI